MKLLQLFFVSLFIVLGMASCGKTEQPQPIDDFNALSAQFAAPSKEYGTAPLYVWNTKVTKSLIDSSMQGFKNNGFGGVFIHPRPGLITEYLSDEWYDLYRHTIETGKKLDMNVWIYDENSYPSGFAGGHVPAQMPESYNQGNSLRLEKYDTFPDTLPALFLCLKKENDAFRDITADMANEVGTKGEYYGFRKGYYGKSPWYGGYSYVDLLHSGVTQKFIEITMDGYKSRFGEEFGKTVPGWFTDEPSIAPSGGIRWTPDLFDAFKARWGYDLKGCLPSLFEEVGEWQQVRHNYQSVLLDLFIERWAKPCHDYCEENNLIFTGHYWEHDWPSVYCSPDNMAMYAWHQMPAIDMLFNIFDDVNTNAQFGNIRSVKEVRSVANQMGYRRTLSETYGGGGWDETFKDFKRLGDWEYALGINFMNQHLADLSIAGARKNDYPPTFSEHSPWWAYYKLLNGHFARLSLALSAGEQQNNILVLEPTTSVWLYFAYRRSHQQYMQIGEEFQRFVTHLEKNQVEYDIASENILKTHGRINDKKFVVGKRAYSKVVIPPLTENLDAPTFALLKEYVAKGGEVIAYSRPLFVDGAPNMEIREFFDKDIVVNMNWGSETPLHLFQSDEITFNNIPKDLFHHRRKMKDGQLLFLANSSLTDAAKGAVSLDGKDAVVLNTLTGDVADYPETVSDNRIDINYELPPAGSLLLYVFDKKQSGYALPVTTDYTTVIPATSQKIMPTDDNVLTLDFCDVKTSADTYSDLHVYKAADKVFKQHGFSNGNPWNTSVQYKNQIVSRDTFQRGGFTALYRFTVNDNFDMTAVKAVVERPALYTIRINGNVVTPDSGKWWFDRDMGVVPVGKHLKKGENVLSLEVSPMSIMAEIEPVYILGNFSVKPAAKGWTLAAPIDALALGSWKAQGMPFYARSVSYKKTFNITDVHARYAVFLGEWKGTVCEITVNGKQAGIIGFEPYSLDVSELITEGENTVEVNVTGSNKNLLGPFHRVPRGLADPGSFISDKPCPSGIEYHQLDYGLLTDFELKSGK
ncbi:MAG: hypothetical protein LBT48_00100 [Prevotellaceae bacterium]|jgi:hypothetical protein|nr:hypothetical protein [Prevotellaceae bacterium]